jgi:hydrogenase maturation protein HypF
MPTSSSHTNLIITPDLSPCEHCCKSITNYENSKYLDAFISCTKCGPRYSINKSLPFEKIKDYTESNIECPNCLEEINHSNNENYHSQPNNSRNCSIQMHFYDGNIKELPISQDQVLVEVANQLKKDSIIAVKGVGSYLLLCDATNKKMVAELRKRKQTINKPFALIYADTEMLQADLSITTTELSALKEKSAPIVLCKIKNFPENKLDLEGIAPGLTKLGVMLPASPLLQLLANFFSKPMIATSGNLSGSPIIYKDKKAKKKLIGIADYLLSYDREITSPQDDS